MLAKSGEVCNVAVPFKLGIEHDAFACSSCEQAGVVES